MEQVHGSQVVRVSKKDDGKIIPNCDALITNDPAVKLCVRVADCLPIFVSDPTSNVKAVIHTGWRGLSKGIIKSAIKKMENQWKVENDKLRIFIGPHICQKHYEIKSDVVEKFKKYPKAIIQKDGKIFLDLAKVAKLQLLLLGIKKENIKIDKRCTFEDPKLFSYRRNKTKERNLFTLDKCTLLYQSNYV